MYVIENIFPMNLAFILTSVNEGGSIMEIVNQKLKK